MPLYVHELYEKWGKIEIEKRLEVKTLSDVVDQVGKYLE